jgi:hypothetical protein
MKVNRYLLSGLFVVTILSSSAMAQTNNTILFDAMSTYEDLTEYALDQNKEGIDQTIKSLDELVDKLKNKLSKKAIQNLSENIEKIKIAKDNVDFPKIALYAVDSYKAISEELDTSTLKIPKEVVILDYIGFKLLTLLIQQNVDWNLIKKTSNEGLSQWENIRIQTSDKPLRNVMDTAIQGIQVAVNSKNMDMLRFAAQVDLDLVDLLEGYFEKK